MASTSDWMPGPRTEILEMCRVWIEYMTAARRTAWGVPQEKYTELANLFDAAQTLCHNPASVPDYGIGVSAKPKLQAKAFVTAPSMAPEANA
jgi:hypothetical protein